MRKWLKWIVLALMPIIMLAVVQGYYWYQVKSNLDELIASIRPFVKIEYADLSASLFNDVELQGIQARPVPFKDAITIERIVLQSSSWSNFLSLKTQVRSGVIKDALDLKLINIRYDLNADYAREQPMPEVEAEEEKTSLEVLLCGDERSISRQSLLRMGYDRLSGEMSLLIEPSANSQLVKLNLAAEFPLLFKADASVWLGLSQGGTLRREGMAKTSIKLFGLTLSDLGYNQRWQTYCAQAENLSADTYLDAYRGEINEWLITEGRSVDDSLLDAFVSAKTAQSIVAARLEPAERLEVGALAQSKGLDNVFSGSEFALQVNGKVLEISDDDWRDLQALFGSNVRKAAMAVVSKESVPVEEKPEEPRISEIVPGVVPIHAPVVQKTYQVTPFNELSEHVGRKIKLRTFFGNEISGVLVEASASSISVRHQVEQGRATFPVSKEKIALIEVYR